MKHLILLLFCVAGFSAFAQQATITHREIESDVRPSGKMELVYSNTSFPISNFFVNEKYLLLFSKYKQAFYLLDRETGLIEDELHMGKIDNLIGGKYSYTLEHQKRKYDAVYYSYLSGYNSSISNSLRRVNDSLIFCGIVKMKRQQFFNFYISFTNTPKIRCFIVDNIAVENDFVVPQVNFDLKFNKYYHHSILGQYYYPERQFLILINSPWEKVENKFTSKTIQPGLFIYKKEKGKYYPFKEIDISKVGSAKDLMFYKDKTLLYNQWSASEVLVISKDADVQTIQQPNLHYTNQLLSDDETGKLYLIADVRYGDSTKMKCYKNGQGCLSKYYRQGSYNPQSKAYDVYELDIDKRNFKHIYHISITGQIAKYLNENVKSHSNSAFFRMYDCQLFVNIPVFSPDEQLGVFKVNLNENDDTTHISTYKKTEYRFFEFIEFGEQSYKETMAIVNDEGYSNMPNKYAEILTGKRRYNNKSKTINQSIDNIQRQLQDNPDIVPVQFIAYDSNALGEINYHFNTNNLAEAFENVSSQWPEPLFQMLKSILADKSNLIIEQKGDALHYTTPDGWHCVFVKIKGYWYLYHQFHKYDNMIFMQGMPELPEIEIVN